MNLLIGCRKCHDARQVECNGKDKCQCFRTGNICKQNLIDVFCNCAACGDLINRTAAGEQRTDDADCALLAKRGSDKRDKQLPRQTKDFRERLDCYADFIENAVFRTGCRIAEQPENDTDEQDNLDNAEKLLLQCRHIEHRFFFDCPLHCFVKLIVCVFIRRGKKHDRNAELLFNRRCVDFLALILCDIRHIQNQKTGNGNAGIIREHEQ